MLKKLLKALGLSKKVPRTDKPVGEVTHYYSHLGVAIVKFNQDIPAGKNLTFQGATSDFSQDVTSMQVDRKSVDKAPKGKEVGIKVKDKVREGDKVYLN
ncbi:MAG: translation elongation factor-like protein [Candidatus Harrisonbacteria bacterium]|nr:translation elongation factor-like protein [Candidatus Harrisonbacteria bacterium]